MILKYQYILFSDHAHPRLRRYLTPYPIPPLPPGSVTQIPTDSPKSVGFAFPVHFAPVPCSPDRSKRTSLSQEHLMELLLKKGGSFRPSLMAIDKKSAHSSFPNLLPFAQDKVYIHEEANVCFLFLNSSSAQMKFRYRLILKAAFLLNILLL